MYLCNTTLYFNCYSTGERLIILNYCYTFIFKFNIPSKTYKPVNRI